MVQSNFRYILIIFNCKLSSQLLGLFLFNSFPLWWASVVVNFQEVPEALIKKDKLKNQ